MALLLGLRVIIFKSNKSERFTNCLVIRKSKFKAVFFTTELILLSSNKLATYADNIMKGLKQKLLNRAYIYLTMLSVTQNCVARTTGLLGMIKGNRRKWSRPNSKFYPYICLEGLRKTPKTPVR